MEILKGFEVINLKQPKGESVMTVTSNSLKFNKATAVELNYAPYIKVLLNAKTKQIAIQPCSEKDPHTRLRNKIFRKYKASGYAGVEAIFERDQRNQKFIWGMYDRICGMFCRKTR